MNELDTKVAELAARYRPLAAEILREVIRIPADYVDRPKDAGGDPTLRPLEPREAAARVPEEDDRRDRARSAGPRTSASTVTATSSGRSRTRPTAFRREREARRLLRRPHRHRERPASRVAGEDRRRRRLRRARRRREGQTRLPARASSATCRPNAEWEHLVFGRGSADQLSGVVTQVVATKILLELAPLGALKGAIVRSYATVAEEDNDGGGPQYLVKKVLPGAPPELVPDAVILTEGTGDSAKGALGIYRGQRGRMQIEVSVTGKSCHGSMPWEGQEPAGVGRADRRRGREALRRARGLPRPPVPRPRHAHGLVGAARHAERLRGPRAVRLPFRPAAHDRRNAGEGRRRRRGARRRGCRPGRRPDGRRQRPDVRRADLDRLRAPQPAGLHGLAHSRGSPGDPGRRRGVPRRRHPARGGRGGERGARRKEPRVDRWIFSTDGVGFPVPKDDVSIAVPARKRWVTSGAVKHPAMLGIGPGIEQNTHKIGECVDLREVVHAIAVLARFPSAFVAAAG